ncbi:MAG: acetoin utilization protein AcuC [Candidatus Lokiarchaeota archaeon]|nr:acetoin utilization protein AcuC [Candidatus Lokiarchaeota archaeon]
MKKAVLIDSNKFQDYDFGPSHPLTPKRLLLTRRLIEEFNLLDGSMTTVEEARYATDEEVGLIHGDTFIKLLKKASEPSYNGGAMWEIGLGPGDNPIFPHLYESSCLYVGGSLVAADLLMKNEAEHAFNISGGLHHAMGSKAVNSKGETIDSGRDDRASGFCILNDCAIVAAYLIKKYGVKKIAYLDVDAHAGDGMVYINYKLPNVLTISIHQHGRSLFPGTCYLNEIGEDEGKGYSVNIPIMPYTFEEPYLKILNQAVAPILKAYNPEVLITQLGVDTHYTDPLTMLALSTNTYRQIAKFIHKISHKACNNKWIALGGGGYSPDIVGKSWMLYFAEMAEKEVSGKLTQSWIEYAKKIGIKIQNEDVIDEFDIETRMKPDDINYIKEKTDEIIEAVKETIFPYFKI